MTTTGHLNSTRRQVDLPGVICNRTFDFAAGELAVVLRHVVCGFDLTHPSDCLEAHVS